MDGLIETLNNMHSPICIYEPLLYFVNNAKMNIIHCNEVINVLDLFPMLKSGHCQRATITTLLILYCKMNGLYYKQMIRPDELMIEAFDKEIPSHFYIDKKLMCEAVNENIISKQLNTFDIIKLILAENFNHESFHAVYLTSVCYLNSDQENVEDEIKTNLAYEFELLSEIHTIITFISPNNLENGPKIDLIEVLKIMILHKLDILLNELIKNKYIKLLYNILLCNDEKIKELLLYVDPRDYNNEAYHLALEINNGSELIKQNIIERNLYEERVFNDNINFILGEKSDVTNNLLLHLRSIL